MSSFVSFGSDNPFNLKVGLGKSYKFTFDNQTAFDNFNFLNYGSHIVEKSFPNVSLTITPFGPVNFSYVTEHKMGSVDVSEDCQDCDNFQHEVFISNDDINQSNVEKYIKDCGSSEYSTSNIKILILKDFGNGYKNYLISYCCDLSLDASTDYCTVRWDLNFDIDCSTFQYNIPAEGISISPPNMTCQKSSAVFNSWQCSTDLNKIVYYAKADFCHKGCSSDNVEGNLLIPPQVPDASEINNLSIVETPTPTSYEIFPPPSNSTILNRDTINNSIKEGIVRSLNSDENDISQVEIINLDLQEDQVIPDFEKSISTTAQDLVGDKPHFASYCHFLGHSKVLNKINNSDLSDRVFYRETIDGYFYKFQSYLQKGSGENSLNVNGSDTLFINEEETDKNTLPKIMFANTPRGWGQLSDKLRSSFVSLIDHTSNPISPTQNPFQLIKDESLFDKIYYFPNQDLLPDSTVLSLNWSYWLFELPKNIYGKNLWWEGLDQQFLPSFEIETENNKYSFQGESNKIYFSHTNNNPDIEKISLIKQNAINSNYSAVNYLDPVYNVVNNINFTGEQNIRVKYNFSPKPDLISTDYQQFTYPLSRVEGLKFFPENLFLSSKNEFIFNYAVDKTLGVINPKHKLIQGLSSRMFDL